MPKLTAPCAEGCLPYRTLCWLMKREFAIMLMQHSSRPIAKDELKPGRTACHQQWNAERLHVAHCLGMSCQGEIEAAQPVPTQGVSTCSGTLPVISHTFYPNAPSW